MSQPEFEPFLREVTHSLQLNERQRQAVADELRDHLDEQLQQFLADGCSREEACQQALAELGDASTLARDFTVPQQRLQRRRTVRYTLTSATLVVTTFVMASFYWPVQRPEPSGQVVAQSDPVSGVSNRAVTATPGKAEMLREEIEAKLARRDLSFSMTDTTFVDALNHISDALDVDIVVNWPLFNDNGVNAMTPISLKLRQGSVSAKTALRLLLRQVNLDGDAVIVIRDGFIDINHVDSSHEVQVYNCRDLLENVDIHRTSAGTTGGGMFQVGGEGADDAGVQHGGGLGGMIGGGAFGGGNTSATSDAGAALIHVLQQATQAEWRDLDGNGGTMTEFNGLITIGHSQPVHERVAEILAKLREANAQRPSANVPPAKP